MPDNSPNIIKNIWSLATSPKGLIAIISYCAGIITVIVTPWIKWFFKRKEIELNIRINNRKERIRQWREEISNHKSWVTFFRTPTYYALKNKISQDEINELLKPVPGLKLITPDEKILNRFHELVSKIEKEWGII
jgi:hypothetical protein